jgi:hygromycin-B 7''-O-kinase
MPWMPPAMSGEVPLRARLAENAWRVAIQEIAQKHGLWPCALEPYDRGETIVWRAGEHVIKVTIPQCSYQIEAEVGCLTALEGKLSVTTPRLLAHGDLSGWPYVVMDRIQGVPLAEVWEELDHEERLRLARDLGSLCRELHSLPLDGFPTGWRTFWATFSSNVGERHRAHGDASPLVLGIDSFLEKVGPLDDSGLVPLHTELIDQHVYVSRRGGRVELSGLIDFADARVGAPFYEFGALSDFIFKGERGLLRELMLAYGVPAAELTEEYSEKLLAWSLCHRFASLPRTLSKLAPPTPASLEELARRLYSVSE